MYDEVCRVWKLELENAQLQKLSPDFYPMLADYFKRLREESRMLDKRALKANLLKKEMENVKHMSHELIMTRYQKIVRTAGKGEEISHDLLTPEEETIYSKLSPFSGTVQNFVKEILRGRIVRVTAEVEHKRAALRFLKDVPAIIGADMKTYGPFKAEDVSDLPLENTKILVKQGLAQKIEIN